MDSGKVGNLSQTPKAIRLRNDRSSRRNEKRFNSPLRAFLQHKYPAIYAEYTDLYLLMTTKHPKRNKLVSTPTFRRWKESNTPIPPVCDVLTQALNETLSAEIPDQNTQALNETLSAEIPDQNTIQNDQHFPPPVQHVPDQSNHSHDLDTPPPPNRRRSKHRDANRQYNQPTEYVRATQSRRG